MAIIHDEHGHVVDHKKTGDSRMKNTGKIRNAGGRCSGYKPGGSFSGGGSNMKSDRGRTITSNGTSSDSSGTGKQSTWESLLSLDTKKCAGQKHCFLDCSHTSKDKAIVMLAEYKKKRNADKKKANLKTLGRNREKPDNRDDHTASFTAENLGI
jgi:hypothetical protein